MRPWILVLLAFLPGGVVQLIDWRRRRRHRPSSPGLTAADLRATLRKRYDR